MGVTVWAAVPVTPRDRAAQMNDVPGVHSVISHTAVGRPGWRTS